MEFRNGALPFCTLESPELLITTRIKPTLAPRLFRVLYIFAPHGKKNLVLVKSPSQCLIETLVAEWPQLTPCDKAFLRWSVRHQIVKRCI